MSTRLVSHRASALRAAAVALLALAIAGCGAKARIMAPNVTVPASDSAPSWSPDGTKIAYAHTAGTVESPDRAGIYLADTMGSPPLHILTGSYSYPDWSPGGRHLVVSGGGIFTITATGDSLTRISSALGYAAKWSPDGSTIAYETYDETKVYRLWLMASDGSGVRCLNASGGESWFEPDWSPDGAHLAHVRIGAGIPKPELFVMDATGRTEQRLTSDGYEARYPAWSPDGGWIVWGSWRGSSAELWLMWPDGTWARKIANGWWPDWSPDSQHIAYTAAEAWNGAYHLFVVDLWTGRVRQLTH